MKKKSIKKSRKKEDIKKMLMKLSNPIIQHLMKFVGDESERLNYMLLNKKVLKSFQEEYDLKKDISPDFFKFFKYYEKLQNTSSNFCEYINTVMNINIFNIPLELINPNIKNDKGATKGLIEYINCRYNKTNNNSFLITILNKKDFDFYLKTLPLIHNYENFKYTLYINKEAANMDEWITLFSKLKYIKNFLNVKSKSIYTEIQNQIIIQKIECYHTEILNTSSKFINTCLEYFEKFPDHLFKIIHQNQLPLCKYNINSIKKIKSVSPIILDKADEYYSKIKFEKFKYFCNCEKLDNIINSSMSYKQIKEFGGFQCEEEEELEPTLEYIKKLENLEELIYFDIWEECDESKHFAVIKEIVNKDKITKIKIWGSPFDRKNVYPYMVSNFKNLRVVKEDYDISGLYDTRFEIDDVFSAAANTKYSKQINEILVHIVNNYLKHKKIGQKFINITVTMDYQILGLFFEYLYTNNYNNILNSIGTIDNYNDGNESGDLTELKGIKKMNYLKISKDNEQLIPLLKNVESIDQLVFISIEVFRNYKDSISKFNPISLIFQIKSNIDDDEFIKVYNEIVGMFNNLKFIILNDKYYTIIQNKNLFNITNVKVLHISCPIKEY